MFQMNGFLELHGSCFLFLSQASETKLPAQTTKEELLPKIEYWILEGKTNQGYFLSVSVTEQGQYFL